MTRPRKLALEPLEEKTLLSTAAIAIALFLPALVASPSPGVSVKLTTDHRVYQAGEPVVITLTETNTSQHAVNIVEGPSTSGFLASRGGRKVWASNAGIEPMFLVSRTLQPGQSITLSATWNGQSDNGSGASVYGRVTIGSQISDTPRVNIVILRS